MVRQILPAIAFLFLLSSCSTFRPLNFTSSRQITAAPSSAPARFIEEISVTPQTTSDRTTSDKAEAKPESKKSIAAAKMVGSTKRINTGTPAAEKKETRTIAGLINNRTATRNDNATFVESASSVQLKYAVLMNTEVENLPSKNLLDNVDEWYGVRYRTGGNTKSGVDCSGFTVAVYAALYGYALPRVSKEQYRISTKISTTELQEGDLVFFNTKGNGVSHVGIYLGNNKFIHASVSRGVMVSGLFEPYYVQRFVGAGRIEDKQLASASSN